MSEEKSYSVGRLLLLPPKRLEKVVLGMSDNIRLRLIHLASLAIARRALEIEQYRTLISQLSSDPGAKS